MLLQPFGALLAQSGGKYASDLAAFFKEVDDTYPFFDLKGIRQDWAGAKPRLMEKAKTCTADTEFLGIALEAVRCLRDSHMGLQNNKAPFPQFDKKYFPGISFLPATKDRVVIMVGAEAYASKLKPGTVVTQIDGQDARKYLDDRAKAEWSCDNPHYASSPQRARLFVYRIPLAGPQGAKHTLKYLEQDNQRELEVSCNLEARGWPHYYNLPENRKAVNASVTYSLLPSGAGYMYLRYVRPETVEGMRNALEACPNAKGWIIDLRGNGGGGYDNSLIELLKNLPRPVVALIDAGCISAGETLARDLARFAEARLMGSKTAGASSSKRQWTFPSGIATVTFSTRSRWRNDGQPIEFNGIVPDVEVEVVPEEAARGQNSEIRRAEEYLAKNRTPSGSSSRKDPAPRMSEVVGIIVETMSTRELLSSRSWPGQLRFVFLEEPPRHMPGWARSNSLVSFFDRLGG